MSEMNDVDHTHPHTDEPFGAAFRRGPTVAADGGERSNGSRSSSERSSDGGRDSGTESRRADADDEVDAETMGDVDHESPSEGATRAFERGTEGRTDSV